LVALTIIVSFLNLPNVSAFDQHAKHLRTSDDSETSFIFIASHFIQELAKGVLRCSNMPSNMETTESHVISDALSNARSNALILNAGGTILPDPLALLVSRLSYVGTLSIRSSALLAEAALEGARIGTITGLEMGRKTLEGLVTSVFDLLVRDSNNFGGTQRGTFGTLVEKYSNLGVLIL
jgi:hypothetical protein